MELIYEKSQAGRRAGRVPNYGLPVPEVPAALARKEPPRLPELAENEIVRHFTNLADRNFGIDTGFYPLGSCTMKYNPRVNERVARLPGFAHLHPHQEDEGAQGALELMWELQQILAEVAGLPAVTLQPAAGSQGELTGLMLMRAYFADRGEGEQRDTIITADTAHGTNPASVTMAGYKLEKVATTDRGNLDLDDLRAKVNERTAGLMLTNPSTLGLFDEDIVEVARIFHDAGALLYYDGANLNAVVGRSRPGDMGFDIVHYNLHKTFSQPHGGGGPGGGPVAVRADLEPFLPSPQVVRDGDAFRLDRDRPKSIGRVRGFAGPFGVFVRSYAFMRAYGPDLQAMSETAVLNANYVLAGLRDDYEVPYDRLCMHEFVVSARALKKEYGITALDIAKRLMDYGVHPPTIYFPLVVPEALMVEPTETEPKERLDAFIEVMKKIAREAAENPELLKSAPQSRPVRRLDEVKAAKEPIVKHAFDERAAHRSGGLSVPIFRELIALSSELVAAVQAARPRAPRAAARRGVHAQRRCRRARPRGVPRGGVGPVRDRRVRLRGDRPGDLRRHRRARLALPADGAARRPRPLARHARDGHLGAARRPLADRAPPRHDRRPLSPDDRINPVAGARLQPVARPRGPSELGAPVSSHSRHTQSPSDAPPALSAAGTIVTPQAGQMGGSSSTVEV